MLEKLKALQSKNKLPHALLLSGPSGVGKYTAALELATSILNASSLPHPDLHIVCPEHKKAHSNIFQEPSSSSKLITVESIREVQNKLNLKPYIASHAVCIIEDADKMNLSAANCLLKTLEEPPPHVKIILTSANKSKLPATILSRAQVFTFGKIEDQTMRALLEKHCSSSAIELLKFAKGSWEKLDCEEYFDSYSRESLKPKKLESHLSKVAQVVKDDTSNIKRLLSDPSNLAAFVAESPTRLTILKEILLREIISGSNAAPKLEAIVKAEDEATTRNANLKLQLTAALSS